MIQACVIAPQRDTRSARLVEVQRRVGCVDTVAKTRRAFQVADDIRSDAFPHRDELDTHRQEEGVLTRSVFPSRWKGWLIGILLAGRRRAHATQARQTGLVELLGHGPGQPSWQMPATRA